MKLADLYHEAIFWACYLENFPDPGRFLGIFGLSEKDRLLFDGLGKFFPFEEFYTRGICLDISRAINDLRLSKKRLLLPWMYRPIGAADTLCGKHLLCPSDKLFILLDNKLETKKLFNKLGLPTPEAGLINRGELMVEKPVRNSAGGLGIQLTRNNAREGFFLEEYFSGYRSCGLHFFVSDETEFICADEMLYDAGSGRIFTFHAQINIEKDELPKPLVNDCFTCIECLRGMGYRGFINIDALVGETGHYLVEINPRGGAFLPAFFAAASAGWTRFMTHTREGTAEKDEIVLLDFGRYLKVVRNSGDVR